MERRKYHFLLQKVAKFAENKPNIVSRIMQVKLGSLSKNAKRAPAKNVTRALSLYIVSRIRHPARLVLSQTHQPSAFRAAVLLISCCQLGVGNINRRIKEIRVKGGCRGGHSSLFTFMYPSGITLQSRGKGFITNICSRQWRSYISSSIVS